MELGDAELHTIATAASVMRTQEHRMGEMARMNRLLAEENVQLRRRVDRLDAAASTLFHESLAYRAQQPRIVCAASGQWRSPADPPPQQPHHPQQLSLSYATAAHHTHEMMTTFQHPPGLASGGGGGWHDGARQHPAPAPPPPQQQRPRDDDHPRHPHPYHHHCRWDHDRAATTAAPPTRFEPSYEVSNDVAYTDLVS